MGRKKSKNPGVETGDQQSHPSGVASVSGVSNGKAGLLQKTSGKGGDKAPPTPSSPAPLIICRNK
jgi:hypothetical protein